MSASGAGLITHNRKFALELMVCRLMELAGLWHLN